LTSLFGGGEFLTFAADPATEGAEMKSASTIAKTTRFVRFITCFLLLLVIAHQQNGNVDEIRRAGWAREWITASWAVVGGEGVLELLD
jgi:hypothetical protein